MKKVLVVIVIVVVLVGLGLVASKVLFAKGLPSAKSLESDFAVAEEAAKKYQSAARTGGSKAGAKQAADFLSGQGAVKEAQVASDGRTVTALFKNGMKYHIFPESVYLMTGAGSPPAAVAWHEGLQMPEEPAPDYKGAFLLDLVAWQCHEQGLRSPSEAAEYLLRDHQVNCEVVRQEKPSDQAAKLEDWRTMGEYALALVVTHGGVDALTNETIFLSGVQPDLETKDEKLAELYRAGALSFGCSAGGRHEWVLHPGFFAGGEFDDNLVYMAAPGSAASDSAQAGLKQGGAAVMCGFNAAPSMPGASQITAAFIDELVKSKKLSEAMASLASSGLDTDPGWQLIPQAERPAQAAKLTQLPGGADFTVDRLFGERLENVQELWDRVNGRFRYPVDPHGLGPVLDRVYITDVKAACWQLSALAQKHSDWQVAGLAKLAFDGSDFLEEYHAVGTKGMLGARTRGAQQDLARELFSLRVGLEVIKMACGPGSPVRAEARSLSELQDLLAGKSVAPPEEPEAAAPAAAPRRTSRMGPSGAMPGGMPGGMPMPPGGGSMAPPGAPMAPEPGAAPAPGA